jgi:hypothetical protein
MRRRLRELRPRSFRRGWHVIAGLAVVVGMLVALVGVGGAWWTQREPSRLAPAESGSASAVGSARSSVSRLSSRAAAVHRATAALRLLVADAPAPFVLDVDRGSFQRITGLPADGRRNVSVLPVGDHALVLSQRSCAGCPSLSRVYLLRRGSTAATPLARGLQAVPSRDGESVWMLSRRDGRHCTIGKIELDGRPRRRPRPVQCRAGLVAELSAGLLISSTGPLGRNTHNALLKPSGRIVGLRYDDARPVVGDLVLTGTDRRTPLLLHDVRTRASVRLRWPSRRGYSLGEVTGDRNGRLAIVEFAKYSPEHRLDIWLLEAGTGRWQHLPAMPARLIPKVTDIKWTADGRVVILSSNVLAAWRPGETRLAMRSVHRPTQPGIQFVIW